MTVSMSSSYRVPEASFAESNDLLGDVFIDTISAVGILCCVTSTRLFNYFFAIIFL